jgi:putative transposase
LLLQTRGQVELAPLEGVHSFNELRPFGLLGYVPPVEAEANYFRQFGEQLATAA